MKQQKQANQPASKPANEQRKTFWTNKLSRMYGFPGHAEWSVKFALHQQVSFFWWTTTTNNKQQQQATTKNKIKLNLIGRLPIYSRE